VLDFQLRVTMGEDDDDAPRAIAVHPGGAEFVCATAKGCRSVLVALVLLVHALLCCMRLTANYREYNQYESIDILQASDTRNCIHLCMRLPANHLKFCYTIPRE
jgi:hypothetical protein